MRNQTNRLIEIRFYDDDERAKAVGLILENGYSGRSGRARENLIIRKQVLSLFGPNIRYEIVEEF